MDHDPTDRVVMAPPISEDRYAWSPLSRVVITAEQADVAGLPAVDIALAITSHDEVRVLHEQGIYLQSIDNPPGGGGRDLLLRAARSDERGTDGLARAAKAIAGDDH